MIVSVDISLVRQQFPALASGFVFLENAGGSQVPKVVADAIRDYMLESYVQLGAGYPKSDQATETVDRAHDFANVLMNGTGIGKTVLGPSTTQLCSMLAECYARNLQPGDEFIVAENGHESNVGPWLRLQERGAVVKMWRIDRETLAMPLEGLQELLTPRTKIVAFPHVSNILGEIADVRAIADLAHGVGARVVVDGVAFAPHQAVDVAAWDADFYGFSTYKVYGPHMAAMFGKNEAWAELKGPNHFFIPASDVPYKFELGGASHEACAGLLGLERYLQVLAPGCTGRDLAVQAVAAMSRLEAPLTQRLISVLATQPNLRILGPTTAENRVPTVSFVHATKSSQEIAEAVNREGIGIRHGNMYAYRLFEALGLDSDDGAVRISAVHYNTIEEIDRVVECLSRVC